MYKTLFKLLLFQVMEKLTRLESVLEEATLRSDAITPQLKQAFQIAIDGLRNNILAEKSFLNELYTDNALPETQCAEKLQNLINNSYSKICRLSQILLGITQVTQPSEVGLLLKETFGPEFQSVYQQHAIVMTAEPGSTGQALPTDLTAVYLEPLSILEASNPLAWVSLTNQFAQSLLYQEPAFEPVLQEYADTPEFPRVVAALINLRQLGPAYYFNAVLDALLTQDQAFIAVIEPALFYALHHFSFTDKNLVILHEVVEKSRTFLLEDALQKNPPQLLQQSEGLTKVLKLIEQLLPDKVAFLPKHFERAQHLQPRLDKGLLLSGHHLFDFEDAQRILNAEETGTPDETKPAIYDLLNFVKESPNTPREIINAGWLFKLERSSGWLYAAIVSPDENTSDKQRTERLSRLLQTQDHLLIKSIETSEIHRVLLTV